MRGWELAWTAAAWAWGFGDGAAHGQAAPALRHGAVPCLRFHPAQSRFLVFTCVPSLPNSRNDFRLLGKHLGTGALGGSKPSSWSSWTFLSNRQVETSSGETLRSHNVCEVTVSLLLRVQMVLGNNDPFLIGIAPRLGPGRWKGSSLLCAPLDHHGQPQHHVLAHHATWHQPPWASSLG